MIRIKDTVMGFNEWIKPVAAIADESKVLFDKDGIKINVVDPANVAMVNVNIPGNAFESYTSDETLIAGIELCELTGMFEGEGDKETAIMDIITKNGYFGQNKDWKISELFIRNDGVLIDSIKTLDPGSFRKTPVIPDIINTAEFTINSTILKRIIKKAQKISDYMQIKVITNVDNDVEIRFYAEGEYTRKFEAMFTSSMILRCDKDAVSLYSLDYLEDIVNSIGDNKIVNMQLSKDFPLFMRYNILNGGQVMFMMAPRVDSE